MITLYIVSYKYGHLVAHCVESVLNQTVPPDDLVVIDDGVGDCGHLKEKYGISPIKHRHNKGIVDNFNWALERAHTERVMFLGADNWLAPEAIERMSQQPEDIVSCDAWIVGEGRYKKWELPYQPHGSALYNVEKAKAVGGYEASGNKHTEEDSVLFRKMRVAGATFKHIPEPLLYYRRHRWNFNK